MADTPDSHERQTLTLPPGEPVRAAWPLAAFATLLIVGAIYYLHHLTAGIAASRQRTELESRLIFAEQTSGVIADPRFSAIFAAHGRDSRKLLDLIETLEDHRYDDAAAKFTADEHPTNRMLFTPAEAPELRQAIIKAADFRAELDSVQQLLLSADAEQGKIFDRETELRNTFRTLLKFSVNGTGGERGQYYQSGFLEGLPAIPELPDALPDSSALIGYLGGVSVYPGGQLPSDLTAELNRIREAARPLSAAVAAANQQFAEIDGRRAAIEKRRQDLGNAALALARRRLLQLLRADISPTTRAVYDTSMSAFRKIGIELPPLP